MANENNIPNEISLPGSLTGRHDSSLITPIGFASFVTRMKSDIPTISTLSFTTRFKSDVFPIPFANFTTAMKSDIAPVTLRPPEMKSLYKIEIKPLTGRHESSNIAPVNSILGANNIDSATAPVNSILGANNIDSATAPITSTLTGRFDSSDITPIVSQLQGRFESSGIDASPTTPTGRHESSGIDDSATTLDGRHESSAIDSSPTTLDGRHESSAIDSSPTTLDGRHESSGIDDGLTTPDGRHESSAIDDSLTTPDGRFTNSSIDDALTTPDGRHESSAIDDALTTPDGRHESSTIDTTAGVNFINIPDTDSKGFTVNNPLLESQFQGISGADYTYPDSQGNAFGILGTADWMHNDDAAGFTLNNPLLESQFVGISGPNYTYPDSQGLGLGVLGTADWMGNTDATGFTLNNPLLESKFVGISGQTYTYPDSQGLGLGSVDSSQGVNFIDIPNANAVGFTTFNPLLESQFVGVGGAPGAMTYAYPDTSGGGYGAVDNQITNGVNFVDIDNLDAIGFTPSQPYLHSQFQGISGQGPKPTYDYPDNHGLGFGILSNALFSGENTPYTTPIRPDGFQTDRGDELEVSLFSKNSFDGGGIIGQSTDFTHATFGGVQGQVPVMGNNPSGLGQFLEGGNTSGDIGIVDAFDDDTSGAKGFTKEMFDLALPKTQFNGVAGSPGSLEYTYPTEVGPAGVGRLMYDTPFSDAGNPYGGEYTSELAKQIPVNPLITINKDVGTDSVDYNLYDGTPDRTHFHQSNKYQESLGNFSTTITLNGSHPKSFLAEFASREGSPTPLDNMKVLIPGNTGPTGEADVTAEYTHVDGYPNYETHNLSYSSAEVANQRSGFERNELFGRSIDYDNDGLYGHDLKFGGHGDDPNGLKSYKKPHILRDMDSNWGLFGGFDEGAFRGGFLTLGNRALKDVVRNTKHIISDPIKGLLWGLKQIGLQASNPKVETEVTPFLGLKRPTRIFNLGIGLLANMLTGPFGIKLYRHGLLNGLGSGKGLYEAAVKAHNENDRFDGRVKGTGKDPLYPNKGGGNRLIGLYGDLIQDTPDTGVGGLLGGLLGQTGQKITALSDNFFFNGPKSLYGIGGTSIRRYVSSNVHESGGGIEQTDPNSGAGGDSNVLALYAATSYGETQELAMNEDGIGIRDFRAVIPVDKNDNLFMSNQTQEYFDQMNREVLFGYVKYDATRDRGDYLNDHELTDWYNSDDFDTEQDYTDEVDAINDGRDMIKFIIEDVQTEKKVRFRSYVTDINDSISPSWSPTQYVGRPDPVYSYKGAERSVTFTLKLAAMTRKGMKGMYKRANFLYGLAYPHFRNAPDGGPTGTIQAPFIKLTIGDYLYKTPGFFESIAVTIDNNFPWEINLENDPEVAQLPHMLSCALTFKVIGDGPHTSAIQSDAQPDEIWGTHIGGGLNAESTVGKFFEDLHIKDE